MWKYNYSYQNELYHGGPGSGRYKKGTKLQSTILAENEAERRARKSELESEKLKREQKISNDNKNTNNNQSSSSVTNSINVIINGPLGSEKVDNIRKPRKPKDTKKQEKAKKPEDPKKPDDSKKPEGSKKSEDSKKPDDSKKPEDPKKPDKPDKSENTKKPEKPVDTQPKPAPKKDPKDDLNRQIARTGAYKNAAFETSSGLSTMKSGVDRYQLDPRPRMDLSKMSTKEIKERIDRENAERQYNDLFSEPTRAEVGKAKISKLLNNVGSAVSVAGGALTVALALKKLKKDLAD